MELPGATPFGTTALIWLILGNCGLRPLKSTCAFAPPIKTSAAAGKVWRNASDEGCPFAIGKSTGPSPLHSKIRASPALEGREGNPGIAPAGAESEPSGLIAMA